MSPRRPGRTLTTHFASLRVWNLTLTKSDVIEADGRTKRGDYYHQRKAARAVLAKAKGKP